MADQLCIRLTEIFDRDPKHRVKIKNSPVNTPFGWRVRVRTNHKIANKTIPSKNAS